eukprot:TRINITY_DN8270_c0_g1_i1.p1 TRINITY_DN8270_c0_g1~~TRINITY_DN8270_c0_g1_i1.p1  ORF type:complete len:463 (-),score=129.86 TRINITY_DN8270_c0_g1_i1:103-1347(-)
MGIAQAGMIRRKNSLSMLLQTMSGMMIGSVMWFIIGFALTFGDDVGGFIGDMEYTFLVELPLIKCVPRYSSTIPASVFVTFQMMFALMVPVIITGAWAEKLNFRAFLVFVIVWPILVYYPLAHWVWGGGFLAELGAVDFAGGITIHTNAGIASLVVALIMRRRPHHKELQGEHHNIPLTIIGGAFIIMGWYGFNGGSSLAADGVGALAFLNTHIAMCTSGLTWMFIAFCSDRHFHLSEVVNGAFAGMAGITPGSGFVAFWAAFVIGIIVGIGSYFTSWFLANRVQLDDVLDVSSLQGTPGIIGSVLTGFFATRSANPGGVDGWFYGRGIQIVYQMAGVGIAIIWSGFWTFVLVLAMDRTIGIHVSIESQEAGLDTTEVGEVAYDGQESQEDGVYRKKETGHFASHPVAPTHRKR